MTTLQLIYKIATSPEIANVAIIDHDDKTPMQAIEWLSADNDNGSIWAINTSLEKGTMIVRLTY